MTAAPARVLLVINSLELGGAEQQLVRLATHLRELGHEVGVLTLLPGGSQIAALGDLGVPVMHVRMTRLRAASSVTGARRILRQWRPDLVISFLYQSNMVMRLAALRSGIPVVSSIRNEYFGGRPRELAMRATDSLAVRTVVNSRLAAESLRARNVVSAQRLALVPNGLTPADFDMPPDRRNALRRRLGVRDDQMVWLGVGRLWAQKDWPTLIEAVRLLPAEARAMQHVLIAGDGPLEDELLQRIGAAGLHGTITLLGRRSDVPDLLAACDALILTSAYEGMPNVILEAMAARRPVLATRVGGAPELVDDPSTGLLVEPGNPAAVSAVMLRLAAMSAEDRAAMGARARQHVEREYALPVVMDRWSDLIDVHLGRQRQLADAGMAETGVRG